LRHKQGKTGKNVEQSAQNRAKNTTVLQLFSKTVLAIFRGKNRMKSSTDIGTEKATLTFPNLDTATLFSALASKWNFLTTDHAGRVNVYTHAPYLETRYVQHYWKAASGEVSGFNSEVLKGYPSSDVFWQASLVCRPTTQQVEAKK